MRLLVSVIVPVFNAERHLIRCLESITSQTYQDLEVLVIDDGSSDGSRNLIAEHAGQDARIRPIYQANAGVSSARNVGLAAATGDLVSFVDADDWLEANTYALLVEKIERIGADVVTFGYIVDSAQGSQPKPVPERFRTDSGSDAGLGLLLKTQNRFACTRIFRRKVIQGIRFREDIHWGEDTIFAVEALKLARKAAVVETPLYHYVQSEGSATRSVFNPKRITGIRMTEVLEELVRKDHPQLASAVVRTRVNILGILLQDVYAAQGPHPREMARFLKQYARHGWRRAIQDSGVPFVTKLKASVMAVSPKLFVAAHRLRLVVRGG